MDTNDAHHVTAPDPEAGRTGKRHPPGDCGSGRCSPTIWDPRTATIHFSNWRYRRHWRSSVGQKSISVISSTSHDSLMLGATGALEANPANRACPASASPIILIIRSLTRSVIFTTPRRTARKVELQDVLDQPRL